MKVLFIGGTGIISSACSKLAIDKNLDVYLLNRGVSSNIREVNGAKHITADIWNIENSKKALEGYSFDCVIDFMAFETSHIEDRISLFKDITKQYIFISSASAYQTPPKSLPITEKTPLENPVWEYSRNKIACENILLDRYKNEGFPATIVRPSHTYDKTLLPMEGGYTVLNRILNNKPIVVHGDGSSIWTLTHNTDFAVGLVGLIGNKKAIGEAFHITSDEWLSWDNIISLVGKAVGKTPKIVHVTSENIAKHNKEIGDSLLGDKTHSMIFDNSKIKQFVPEFNCKTNFETGIKEVVNWYLSSPEQQIVNPEIDKLFDKLIEKYS